MKSKNIMLGMLCLSIIFVISCNNIPFGKKSKTKPTPQAEAPLPVTGTVIATVNNHPITLEDLNSEIATYNNDVPKNKPELKITTRQKKINYLKNTIIRRILLYQAALDRGLDRNPDVRKNLEKAKEQLLFYQIIKNETSKINATSKEINNYYNRYKGQLKSPEQRKIREIVVISESQAKNLLIRLLQGEDFGSLATQYSKAPDAAKGGEMGFIKPGSKFKAFDEIAFSDALGVGQVSSVFKGPGGYYIIKLEAKHGGQQKSLTDVWDKIKRVLTFIKQQKRIESLVGNLSRNAKIKIKEDKIP